jgi:peptide/nickel transport system substrate-binding protein
MYLCFRLILILFTAQCFQVYAESEQNRIRFGIPTAPSSLDPRFSVDAVSARLQNLLHRSLVRFEETQTVVPDLAEWQKLAPLHYRFIIDEGAYFNDGEKVVASDVHATYKSILDPKTLSPHVGSFTNIKEIIEVDDRTVDFILNEADHFFPDSLSVGILSAAYVKAASSKDTFAASTGPFEVLSWAINEPLVLRRRKDGHLFEFIAIKDSNARSLRLISGEIDIMQGDIPPHIYASLLQRSDLYGKRIAGNTFTYLGFNLREGITSDLKFRQALAHAINREAILKFLFQGSAREAWGLFPPSHWAGAENLRGFSYNPELAREIIEEINPTSMPIILNYKTSTNKFRQRVASVIQSQLASVGVDMKIEILDFGTLMGEISRGDFQAYSLSWVGLKTSDMYRQIFHSESVPPVGKNRGYYRSVRADELIEMAEKESDLRIRSNLYKKLQLLLLDELPYIPLWFEDQLVVMRKDIQSYTTNIDGDYSALIHTRRSRQ